MPELQEKIRRVVEQGHIDAEDFNGVSALVSCPGRQWVRSVANRVQGPGDERAWSEGHSSS